MKQRTTEWFDARLGKITASRFGDVMTKAKSGKGLSAKAESYLLELVTEIMTGDSKQIESASLDWGTFTEENACEEYEVLNFVEVEKVGFIQHPEYEKVGGSPDGLVGDKGIIEIKCPFNSANHISYLFSEKLPGAYYAQIQGNLWITEREWCDFISFDPRVLDQTKRMIIKRVERDEKYITDLEESINNFLQVYEERVQLIYVNEQQ